MKILGRIKLNQFSKDEMERRHLNALKGGCACESSMCSCTASGPSLFSTLERITGGEPVYQY